MRYKRCIMLLADGSRPDVFQSLLDQGRLPEIARWLLPDGALHTGVTVFPSTTGPAYLPFLTGCYPGTCNVPGIRWFDKDVYATQPWSRAKHRSYVGIGTLKMNHDLRPGIKTLFEMIPENVNIFNGVNRGASRRGNKSKHNRIWNWYYAHLTDHWALVDDNATRMLLQSLDEDPRFVFAVYPGIDEYSHMGAPHHPAALASYERLDRAVGAIVAKLQARGQWEETALVIVSDHGLSSTHTHFPVNQFLEKNGMRTFYYPVILKRGFHAAHMVSGNGMSHLYFLKGEVGAAVQRSAWREPCYYEDYNVQQQDVVKQLAEQPAIDFMALKSREGGVYVQRGAELARVYEQADKIIYQRIQGDPLNYKNIPAALTAEAWLSETLATDYPDAPVQLLQILRSSRTGDIMISARPGYDLRLRYEVPEHHGSHGSLHKDHMLIPVLSNVSLRTPHCRSVDVFPTVCDWLGLDVPLGIDGVTRAL